MKYELNITDNYSTMIHFDEMIGLNHFIQLPLLTEKLLSPYEICLENIAINLYSEESPYKKLLAITPDLFIKNYDDPVVLLRKAKLRIEGVKSCKIKMNHKDEDFFHSWKTDFKRNDFCIFCYAHSLDYLETFIYIKLIFSGKVTLSFSDEDMLLHTSGYDICINQESINHMNEEQASKVKLQAKNDIHNLEMNNIKSKLWDYDYFQQYFNRDNKLLRYEAIKDYDYTDE